MVLSFLLSVVLSLTNFLSDKFSMDKSRYKPYFISLVAGISVTYIFLHLLPNLYSGVSVFSRSLFVFVLVGFVAFHVVEKFIYKYVGEGKISEDLKLNHSVWLLIYDISIGIVLVNFFKISAVEGFLFFIPVWFHSALSNLSIHKISGLNFRERADLKNKALKLFLSGGALYGATVALVYGVSLKISFVLTGLVAGILLYVVIREMIPKEKEGRPLFFILGVVLYSLLIFWVWSI